jgi:hypothetical protein
MARKQAAGWKVQFFVGGFLDASQQHHTLWYFLDQGVWQAP